MALLLIDGYNLIGTAHGGHAERERERLIADLAAYRKRRGHDVTVVFDGWREGPGAESRTVTGGVAVVYSGRGENADSVIDRLVRTSGRECIVVSSDREVQGRAWTGGAIPVATEAFLRRLEDRAGGGGDEMDDEEGDDGTYGSRGNPRKLSRKQRAINRALAKL
jgi:hypothetical protein